MTIKIHKCNRCSWEWVSRGDVEMPKNCPRCKSKYWNKKRVRNPQAYARLRTRHKLEQESEAIA